MDGFLTKVKLTTGEIARADCTHIPWLIKKRNYARKPSDGVIVTYVDPVEFRLIQLRLGYRPTLADDTE